MFCKNRPEGFSTKSIHSALPTTCFTDTILLPLPTYILLFALAIITIFSLATRSRSSTSRLRINSTTSSQPSEPRQWHILGNRDQLQRPLSYKMLMGFYYLFVVANALLAVLEIARLSSINFGIALLPFPIIGIVIAGFLHLTRGVQEVIPYWQAVNMVFWALSMVFSVIKTVGLVDEGIEERKGTMYPVEDQVTDTGVMAGLYLFLVIIEGGLWVWKGKLVSRRVEETVKEGSLASLRQENV